MSSPVRQASTSTTCPVEAVTRSPAPITTSRWPPDPAALAPTVASSSDRSRSPRCCCPPPTAPRRDVVNSSLMAWRASRDGGNGRARQAHTERASFARPARRGRADGAGVLLHDAPHDAEAEAKPAEPGAVGPFEDVEDGLELVRWDPHPLIANLEV